MSHMFFRKFLQQTAPILLLTLSMLATTQARAQTELTVEELSKVIAIQQNVIRSLTDRLNTLEATALSKTEAASKYLTKTSAASTYLTTTAASSSYLTKTAASSSYLTKTAAETTYQTTSDANATFLTKTAAADRYPSKAQVKNCTFKMGVALGKDATQPATHDIDKGIDDTWESFWFDHNNDATRLFFDWFCDF